MQILIRPITFLFFALVILQTGVAQAEEINLDSDEKKYSYAVGTKLAQQLIEQFGSSESGVDMQALVAGIKDSINPEDLKMNEAEASEAIAVRQQAQLKEATAKAGEATKRGDAFREANAAKEGVVATDSGIQYAVLTSGDEAGSMPGPDDTVVVHYRGTLTDGTEFDSSIARGEPATFSLQGIIPGWNEVLQLMRPGDKWNVVIPPELGYGERGAGGQIGPNETLVFEIELLEIK